MNKIEFKKLLFKVAFCTMACDGVIDAREIDEIKDMDEKSPLFSEIDLSDELKDLVEEFRLKGTEVIEELFSILGRTKLSPIRELMILEVALRIINADQVHDENELKYLRILRSKLEVHDEIINDRFGKLDILHTSDYSFGIKSKVGHKEFTKSIDLPDIKDISEALNSYIEQK